ncbi:MAG: phosphoribosylformylglycinamidine synthase subunit PurS, partial [Coriobacteriaceae bacterium]|nr:phosphoribosylformylglycinamidine synthase subunit PurS [Coriobacteriaceae bacterium]
MKRYEIFITAKEGIFDPAGETSKNALLNLGYDGVEGVRIGK